MRAVCRYARLQATWWPRYLALAWLGLGLASCVLTLLLALGEGVRQAGESWLGENLPTDTLDVVPARTSIAGLGFAASPAFGGTPLDARALADLAALPGVRHASAVVDLPLPLIAEGGQALLGRALRADLLVTGIDAPRVQAGTALRVAGAAGPVPFADTSSGPLPALLHPALLATYNATVAPSLQLPQLAAETIVGLTFVVHVGESHLPGRVPAGRRGAFEVQIVGLSQDAQPLGISLPAATARRLWATYAARPAKAEGPDGSNAAADPPVARVRLQACSPAAIAQVARRVAKMGFAVDDAAGQLRAASVLAQRLLAALGSLFFLLAAGYGLQAVAAHAAVLRPHWPLLRRLGASQAQLSAALALQAAAVGLAGAVTGQLAALAATIWLQKALQRAADAWQVQLPAAFVWLPATSLQVVGAIVLATTLGTFLHGRLRLDKSAQQR